MCTTKRRKHKLLGVIGFLLAVLITLTVFTGVEAGKDAEDRSEPQTDFELAINENLISLDAHDASLKAILEEIGRRMQIEVVANIPAEEIITVAFDSLPLKDALRRFQTNYAFVTDSEKEKITKIVVVPKGKQSMPFATTFQPSQTKEGKILEKPEEAISTRTSDEKGPRPEPFKFEFDPSTFLQEGGSKTE